MELHLMKYDDESYERLVKKSQGEVIAVTSHLVIVALSEGGQIVLYRNDGRDYLEAFGYRKFWKTPWFSTFKVEVESFEARQASH